MIKYINSFLDNKEINFKSQLNMIIGIAFGGNFAESDVSRMGAKSVINELESNGYQVFALEMKKSDLIEDYITFIIKSFKEKKFDILFNSMHGYFGEDGKLSKICQENSIPFTHSDFQSSEIAINKLKTKEIMIKNNINTAKYILISKKELLLKSIYEIIKDNINAKKVVVKANCGGSTVDCFILDDLTKQFQKEDFTTNEEEFLIEEFIEGREVTVAILENKALPYIMTIVPQKNTYFDYNSKYSQGGVLHLEEKNLNVEEKNKILADCTRLHNLIGLNNLSRIDIMLTKENVHYFMEVNNVPGLTNVSGVPDIAKECGISYLELLQIIIKNNLNGGR